MSANRKKKLADRAKRHEKVADRHHIETTMSADAVEGRCDLCGQPCLARHDYLVRNTTWAEAGMTGWGSGFLHRECLVQRLGRKLRPEELLTWVSGTSAAGTTVLTARPEYFTMPEFLMAGDRFEGGKIRISAYDQDPFALYLGRAGYWRTYHAAFVSPVALICNRPGAGKPLTAKTRRVDLWRTPPGLFDALRQFYAAGGWPENCADWTLECLGTNLHGMPL